MWDPFCFFWNDTKFGAKIELLGQQKRDYLLKANALIKCLNTFVKVGWKYRVHVLVAKSCPTLRGPRQAPLHMGFSRQEYWRGLPFPSPGDLPDPGIKPGSSCIVGRFFTVWATREALQSTSWRANSSLKKCANKILSRTSNYQAVQSDLGLSLGLEE